jgi:outer membrane lipoprotein carrier protein
MKNQITLISLLLFVVFLPVSAFGWSCDQSESAAVSKQLVTAITEAYRSVYSLKAEFLQQSSFAGLTSGNASKGQVAFEKPGRMHWTYLEPEKQEFISDGRTLWFYQPDFSQVMVSDFTDAFDSELPVSFLLGVGNLEESFTLLSSCKRDDDRALELKPRSASGELERFWLLVDSESYLPTGAKTIDIGGNETVIKLINQKTNVKIDRGEFSFDYPDNVDVIDARGMADESRAINSNW